MYVCIYVCNGWMYVCIYVCIVWMYGCMYVFFFPLDLNLEMDLETSMPEHPMVVLLDVPYNLC